MKTNVLLIVIDSLRSDKCFGPEKTSFTPNLDKLITHGLCFPNTISSAPASIPAVSSILSGLYPFRSLKIDGERFSLKNNIATIPSILKNSGYYTTAKIPKILKLMDLEKIFHKIDYYDDQSTLYDGIGDEIISKLNSLKNAQPWMLYLHLNDIHGQSIFHKDFVHSEFNNKKLGENQYERMLSLVDIWLGKIIEKIDIQNTLIILTADHGSDVASFDDSLEEFSRKTREILKEKKNLMITSGQKITSKLPSSFRPLRKSLSKIYRKQRDKNFTKKSVPIIEYIESQTFEPYHKRLLLNIFSGSNMPYDEKFKVPLIISSPNIKKSIMHKSQIRTIDILPTIMGILNHDPIPNIHGENLISITNGKTIPDIPAYIECHKNIVDYNSENNNENIVGIRTPQFKYFRKTSSSNSCYLFNLEKDPFEMENICKKLPVVVDEMEKLIKKVKNSN